ncbi:TPA: hypothetical protein EYP26_03900 [Candidatus Bathyarchaeota archaeon]|nr:hypothetical protein [Candidatus Bathyarchaeota archaeon]
MDKRKAALAASIAAVAIVDILLEKFLFLPAFYEGLPLPYPKNPKPIGGALFPAAFFHVLLLSASAFAVAFIAEKLGFNLGDFVPKTAEGKASLIAFFVMVASGIAVWWYPIALLPFTVSAAYLVLVEIA